MEKSKRKNRNSKRERKSTIDSYHIYVYIYVCVCALDDFCFALLCERFEERSIASFETRANEAKRKRKMVRAIITATLLSSHRINIIRCIV